MGTVDRKLALLGALAQQRRAGQRYPGSEEIASVTAFLERELGPTVSQRLAARFLGVSHAALGRWVGSGDIPLVYTASGRQELPVHELLRLHESSSAARAAGRRHVLEPQVVADRRAAARLEPGELLRDAMVATEGPGFGHRRGELRALAYHRVVARRLTRADVNAARQTLEQWRRTAKIDPVYAERWGAVLCRPLPAIRAVLGEDSPLARDLRQNSPFAGALSEAERQRIIAKVR